MLIAKILKICEISKEMERFLRFINYLLIENKNMVI